MPLTLSSSNIIVDYHTSNFIFDTVKTMGSYEEYIKEPIIISYEGIGDLNSEEQFPKSAPVGLPTSASNGQQVFDFNLSAVIDSNNYSTYMNLISTGSYQTADTTVGFSQNIDGILYEFRTNHCGEENGKWYEILDNNKANNWYIQYYNWMSGTIYNQYAYNNHDTTYLSDGTIYKGIWLEIGSERNMVLKKYSWSMNDSSTYLNQRKPVIWLICGSNDRNVWTPIHNVPDQLQSPDTIPSTPANQTDIFFSNFTEPSPFKYFRWIVRKLSTDTWWALSTFKLYGYEYIEPTTIKVDPSNSDYRYIVFRNRGSDQTKYSITFLEDTECDILIVAGGGGGGAGSGYGGGGGGGAGGLIYKTQETLSGKYEIMVGKGGLGMTYSYSTMENYNNGSDSGIYDSSGNILYLTKGGGAGGARQTNGASGGSGGGGGGGSNNTPGTGGLSIDYVPYTHSIGYSGGDGNRYSKGGGGGGAGGPGSQATGTDTSAGNGYNEGVAGNGGLPKIIDITGEYKVYAGGGGGGTWQVEPGEGGSVVIGDQIVKVGGDGGWGASYPGNGKPHTGSGGGGAKHDANTGTPQNAGNGGSGVVIIRYKAVKNNVTFGAQWTYNEYDGNVYNIGNVGVGTEAQDKHALTTMGNFNFNGNLYKNNMLITHGKQYAIDENIEINKPRGYIKYKEIRMYPPVRNIASANHLVTGESYGNGVYVTTQSESYDGIRNGYSAFNTSMDSGPHFNTSYTSAGVYNSDKYVVDGYLGDWIKVKMPVKINLARYGFKQRLVNGNFPNRAPGQYKIYGSNDDTTWVELVHKTSTISYSSSEFKEYVTTTGEYCYFALVVNRLVGNDTILNFDEWYIYGKELDYVNNVVDNHTIFDKQRINEITIKENTYASFDFDKNLIMWLKLDDNVKDETGNFTFKRVDGVVKINHGDTDSNYFRYLDTTSNMIQYSTIVEPILADAKAISLMFWMKVKKTDLDSTSERRHIIEISNNNILVGTYYSKELYIHFGSSRVNMNNFFDTYDNVWIHFAFTSDFSKNTYDVYVNGEVKNSMVTGIYNPSFSAPGLNNTITFFKDPSYHNFKGFLRDLRFYNKVLTIDEINKVCFNSTINPNNYKTLTFKHNYIYEMQSRAESITGVNGWVMVKYKPVSRMWWSGNDNLQGNFTMNGGTRSEDEEWATTWDDSQYNQVLFVKGDFVAWLHINSSSLDLTTWHSPTALGGNKVTNGKFRYYRDTSNSDTSQFSTSPYIFDHDVDYSNAYGDMIYQENSDYGYGGVAGNTWTDSGSYDKYPPEEYKYYIFVRKSDETLSNTPEQSEYALNVPVPTICDILLVGGGGSGGASLGGGGGAGGVLYASDITLHGDYVIKVGGGGGGLKSDSSTGSTLGISGSATEFSGTIVPGGGGGGDYQNIGGLDGGSGGGGGFQTSNGGSKTLPTYGSVLTNGNSTYYGNDGESVSGASKSGNGGSASFISNISGEDYLYGKGGTGRINGTDNSVSYDNGINYGDGGGGGGWAITTYSGYGASGVVIIRYKAIYKDPTYKVKEWTYNFFDKTIYHDGNVGIGTTIPEYALDVVGTITGYSKNFKINHPLGKKKWLYHGSVEGARYDNIYRGKKILKNGFAEVNIDTDCNDTDGMTFGTFDKLNTNAQLFLQNNKTYDNVRGTIKHGVIIITSETTEEELEVDWMVVAERKDKGIINSPLTNYKGNLICEHNIYGKTTTMVYVSNTLVSGLYWEYISNIKPTRGVPLNNEELSLALQTKQEFTEDEWLQFDIPYLRQDHFILSGNKYYKPASINNDILIE